MLVYRLGKEKYSRDISGEGAKIFGGRWNRIGTPCIYTSQSRALALLEYTVNVGIDFIPKNLCFTVFEIDDTMIEKITLSEIPRNWNSVPTNSDTKNFGSDKLQFSSFPILRFPSVVIPNENNYLLNPKKMNEIFFKIVDVEPYVYDFRIKK
jgi:RES domain-containing protein